MAQGPDRDKGKPKKTGSAVPPPATSDADQSDSTQGKRKKKVAKTMIFGVDNIPDAVKSTAAASEEQDQPSAAEGESSGSDQQPKRKVAKTLLYNPASVMEAAVLAAAAELDREAASAAPSQSAEGTAPIPEAAQAQEQPIAPPAEAPSEDEKPKRKVAKTLLFDPAKVLAAAAQQTVAARAADVPTAVEATIQAEAAPQAETTPQAEATRQSDAAAAAEATTSLEEKPKRKVPKTMLYDTAKLRQAAAEAEAAAEAVTEATASLEDKPQRKVPKTILYDTANVREAAVEPAAEPVAEVAAESGAEPVAEAAATAAEEAEALASAPSPADTDAPPELNIDSPPVRLFFDDPLDFDTKDQEANVAASVQTHEAPQGERSALERSTAESPVTEQPQEPRSEIHKSVPEPVFDDPPPELNIDSPPVRLFFEDPIPPHITKRRVPRTLLFNPVIGADGLGVDPGQPASVPEPVSNIGQSVTGQTDAGQSAADQEGSGQDLAPTAVARRRISTKKIAKTLIYSSVESSDEAQPRLTVKESVPLAGETPLDTAEAERVVERYIAKTMLDHDILYKELSKSQQKIEAKAIEIAIEKANAPFKPFFPIECDKKALPCQWTWDETQTSERYRYCGQCQRPVYNFFGLEIADAEEIILKAENSVKFTLWRRTDGKFMTSDCPMAVKRRSDTIFMSACGILAAIAMVAYCATLPKPKPALVPAPVASAAKRPRPGLGNAKAGAGSGRWEAGKGFIMDKPAPAPVQRAPIATTSSPDPDESGNMWEFSTPQAGNQTIVDPRAPAPMPTPQPAQQQPQQLQQPGQTTNPSQQQGAQPGQSTYVKTYP